jgi:hypothetical protein
MAKPISEPFEVLAGQPSQHRATGRSRWPFCRTATVLELAGAPAPAMQAQKLKRACRGLANHGASTKHGRGGATRAARCLSTWATLMRKHKSSRPGQDRDAILNSPAARAGWESRGRATFALGCAVRVSFHCHRPSLEGGIHSLFLAERTCPDRDLIVSPATPSLDGRALCYPSDVHSPLAWPPACFLQCPSNLIEGGPS